MAYYYHGLVSWEWFFPAHFAPLAVDFAKGLTELQVRGEIEDDDPIS